MAAVIVGTVKENQAYKGSYIGFNVYYKDEFNVMSYYVMYDILNKHPDDVINARAKNGTIVGTQGGLERYPCYVNNAPVGKEAAIILNRISVIDYTGKVFSEIFKMYEPSKSSIVFVDSGYIGECMKDTGVANAKLVIKNGKTYISSLGTEFETMQMDLVEASHCTMSDFDYSGNPNVFTNMP